MTSLMEFMINIKHDAFSNSGNVSNSNSDADMKEETAQTEISEMSNSTSLFSFLGVNGSSVESPDVPSKAVIVNSTSVIPLE